MHKVLYLLLLFKDLQGSIGVEHCKEWMSHSDWQFRSHCYWFHTVPSDISVFEANIQCTLAGDGLAPYIDNEQYNFIESLRPSGSAATFIGVMDVGKEGEWTHLDGTSIADNGFYTTFDPSTSQPNGGTGQNCAIINPNSGTYHNKTQDKECHTYKTSAMICYRNNQDRDNCLSWVSTADGVSREHCYWVKSRVPSSTSFHVIDAMTACRRQGGFIAPLIDDEQFIFIQNITMYYMSFGPTALMVWTGTHNNGSRGQNWNLDPFYVSTSLVMNGFPSAGVEETCLVFISQPGPASPPTASWELCTPTHLQAVLCYKSTTRFIPLVKPQNISTIDEIIQELIVDPTETNAYRLSKISVYEDRPVAKALGGIGIAILLGTMMFVVMLDCQRLENLCNKRKRKSK